MCATGHAATSTQTNVLVLRSKDRHSAAIDFLAAFPPPRPVPALRARHGGIFGDVLERYRVIGSSVSGFRLREHFQFLLSQLQKG